MSLLDDLTGFNSMLSDLAGGDQATRDNLPPGPPQVPLSTRTQQFLNTLIYPMNAAWGQLWTAIGGDPSALTDPVTTADFANIIVTNQAVPQAQAYLDYAQWVIPYLECCGNIAGGYYTGQDYKDILTFLNVSSNDFPDTTAYDTYAKPHVVLAKNRRDHILGANDLGILTTKTVTYPNAAPPLPADYTNFFKRQLDHVTGNDTGDSNLGTYLGLGTFIAIAIGVGVIYLILRFR